MSVTRADGEQRAGLVSADNLRAGEHTIVLCIVRDVTERLAQDPVFRQGYQALHDGLAQARRDASETVPPTDHGEDRMREFTRAVAHDLRAPLLAIQGFMGLMRERLQLGHTDEALKYSELVDKATRRVNAMIEALCNLTQIDQHALKRRSIDMRALVEDTWALVQRTWYRVTDNGAGFDMAHARALFQPFRRMHAASQFEGSGIGLSMVQRIVRHHGGEVRVRSQVGVGTVAEFTLDRNHWSVQTP